MEHKRVLWTLIGIPAYVFLAFATTALAPVWEQLTGAAASEPIPQQIVLTFVGDMMFDRYVRERAAIHGYDAILADTRTLFASSTYLFGNLEGPITTFAPVSDYRDGGPNHYRFTFATETAALLGTYRFGAVTLNNNHVTNFGDEGVQQTKRWLETQGVGYVGAPDDLLTPWRTATSGSNIAVYAYSPWHTRDIDALLSRIGAESTTTLVVVLAHWGEEYDTTPNTPEVDLAHRMVDAGADLVMGSHPHVVQSKEEYRGAWIYYSLGNFVFDQYFGPHVQCGVVVHVTKETDGTIGIVESFVELQQDGTTAKSTCQTAVPLR